MNVTFLQTHIIESCLQRAHWEQILSSPILALVHLPKSRRSQTISFNPNESKPLLKLELPTSKLLHRAKHRENSWFHIWVTMSWLFDAFCTRAVFDTSNYASQGQASHCTANWKIINQEIHAVGVGREAIVSPSASVEQSDKQNEANNLQELYGGAPFKANAECQVVSVPSQCPLALSRTYVTSKKYLPLTVSNFYDLLQPTRVTPSLSHVKPNNLPCLWLTMPALAFSQKTPHTWGVWWQRPPCLGSVQPKGSINRLEFPSHTK